MPIKKKLRRFLLIAAVALCAIAALIFFRGNGSSNHAQNRTITTAPVVMGDIEDTVLASGVLKAAQQVDVGAQVSGEIKSLKVTLGDHVKKGQLIAEIDSRPQLNETETADAALASLHSQRIAKQAALKRASLVYTRLKTLLAADATSHDLFEEAEAALASAKADLAALDSQIRQAEMSSATAKLNLGYTRITSPIDGVIVAIASKEGQTVNSAQSAPTIVSVAQLDTMVVKARISEADIAKVSKGQEIYFSVLGNPKVKYPATLEIIEPIPDNSDKDSSGSSSSAIYYNGLFRVEHPAKELRIAMTVQVSIVLASAKNVLLIPASVLTVPEADGSYTVLVMQGQAKQPRKVMIGINNNVNAEVKEGLSAGELIVTNEMSAAENPDE